MAALLLCAASVSPWGAPTGTFQPEIYGIPYTLWMGFVITVALVALTYVATRVYPPNQSDGDDIVFSDKPDADG